MTTFITHLKQNRNIREKILKHIAVSLAALRRKKMNKKFLVFAAVLFIAASVFAVSFTGISSVGGNYTFRDGEHLGGLSSQNFGYINDCPVGYFVGVNADFNLQDDMNWALNMIVGPSYSYMFSNVPMSVDVALGLSLSGEWIETSEFGLGIGGYLGTTWHMNEMVALFLGCSLGYDMLGVSLDTGDTYFSGDFFVSPSLAIGFTY